MGPGSVESRHQISPQNTAPQLRTDHTFSQSKGSLDRLDEKPLDLGPPLPPKAEASTFISEGQTPRPGSAGEGGHPGGGGTSRWGRGTLNLTLTRYLPRERPVCAEDQPPNASHVQIPASIPHGPQGALLRAWGAGEEPHGTLRPQRFPPRAPSSLGALGKGPTAGELPPPFLPPPAGSARLGRWQAREPVGRMPGIPPLGILCGPREGLERI